MIRLNFPDDTVRSSDLCGHNSNNWSRTKIRDVVIRRRKNTIKKKRIKIEDNKKIFIFSKPYYIELKLTSIRIQWIQKCIISFPRFCDFKQKYIKNKYNNQSTKKFDDREHINRYLSRWEFINKCAFLNVHPLSNIAVR